MEVVRESVTHANSKDGKEVPGTSGEVAAAADVEKVADGVKGHGVGGG